MRVIEAAFAQCSAAPCNGSCVRGLLARCRAACWQVAFIGVPGQSVSGLVRAIQAVSRCSLEQVLACRHTLERNQPNLLPRNQHEVLMRPTFLRVNASMQASASISPRARASTARARRRSSWKLRCLGCMGPMTRREMRTQSSHGATASTRFFSSEAARSSM